MILEYRSYLSCFRPVLASAGVVLTLSGAAHMPALAQEIPVKGGNIVMAVGLEPSSLNPVISTLPADQYAGCAMYEGLTEAVGNDGRVVPLLARSWKISADGLTYDFQLADARWHDGTPFTAEDVRWSLLELSSKLNPLFAGHAGAAIKEIVPVSDRELRIELKYPFAPLLRSLDCRSGAAIMPKHLWEGKDILATSGTAQHIGTGPFLFTKWSRGQFVQLERNPAYWDKGKPYVDRVIMRSIPQASARTQALLAGEINYLPYFYLPSNDLPLVMGNPKLKTVISRGAPSQDIMFFNTKRAPFDRTDVRQAILIGTDLDMLLKNGWLNVGFRATAPFSQGRGEWWQANESARYDRIYAFDAARANSMLDAAGLSRGADGFRIKAKLAYVNNEIDLPRVALILKEMWKKIGIDLTLVALDDPSYSKQVFTDMDFDLALTAYNSFWDPSIGLARMWTEASLGRNFGNPSGWFNPKLDALFTKAEQTIDQDRRREIYAEIQDIAAGELPVVTLHERLPYDTYDPRLHGVELEAVTPSWKNVWISK